MRYGVVSFISDYGLQDEFVGVVHSVIASIAPGARVVDVTHGIAPHDVRAGGLALARAAPYLSPGVVLAVIDPGVGTGRRAVAVEVGDGASVLVGPDNGLLGPAVALVGGANRAVELLSEEHRLPIQSEVGRTFDGRDVFAPAAAHLCNGVPLSSLGPAVDPAALMPGILPVSRSDDSGLMAEVLWIDRFGNCQLNLTAADIDALGPPLQVITDDDQHTAERSADYDTIAAGRVGLVVDSTGLISLAVPRRSAAAELGLNEGSEVRLLSIGGDNRPARDRSGRDMSSAPVELGRRERRHREDGQEPTDTTREPSKP